MAGEALTLRFIFTSYESASLQLEAVPLSLGVRELKERILLPEHWPKEIDPPPEIDRVRLIAGGALLVDGSSLSQCRLPTFAGAATPVNVSIRPPGTVPSRQKKGGGGGGGGGGTGRSGRVGNESGGGGEDGAAGGERQQSGATDAGSTSCCVVS